MMTGRRLTHKRLANWRITTFSDIVSRQYAMAYDNYPNNTLDQRTDRFAERGNVPSFQSQSILELLSALVGTVITLGALSPNFFRNFQGKLSILFSWNRA